MSTGNYVEDRRSPVSTSCGAGLIGSFFRRVYSGVNGSRSEDHPYSCQVISNLDTVLEWSTASNPGIRFTGTASSCGFAPTWTIPPLPDDYLTKMTLRLEEMLKGHEFNAAVNLGEARESVGMIGSTARSLARSFLSLKKGNASDALRHLGVETRKTRVREVSRNLRDSAGTAWLGMTYGWKPLLASVDDAAQAAARNLLPRRTSVRAQMTVPGSVYGAGSGFTAVGYANRRVQIIWRISEKAQFTTLQEFGFTSPELVAWELMPYSFVVDWFLPIGNFLQARALLGMLEGTAVVTHSTKASVRMGSSPDYIIHSGNSFRKEVIVSRTVGAIGALPLMRPHFKNPLSVSHALSGIALLNNVFRK